MTPSGEGVDLSHISIVVLSHNRRPTVARTVAALVDLARATGCELIVVDNASSDGTRELLCDLLENLPGACLISNTSNLGVAAGRNVGWREARREFILNLDDDISLDAEDVARMAGALRQNDSVGAVAPRIVDFNTGKIQYDYGDSAIEIANFQGACHMVRRQLVQSIGLNDERCSFGGEELDLSIRIRAVRKVVLFTPMATVAHDHQVRSGHENRGRRLRWIYNFVRVFYKHFPGSFASTLSFRSVVSHLVSGVRLFGLSFGVRVFLEALRGVRDGIGDHATVPDEVVKFYRNPNLRPEFGNVPLWVKARNRLRSRMGAERQ